MRKRSLRQRIARAIVGAGVFLAAPALAELDLAFPLDCTLGRDCHIQNYVDHAPGPGFVDYNCGSLGYDGHQGTDFALPSELDIRSGVAVRAAAAGIVRGTRDGMADQRFDRHAPDPAIKGRECGNGVLVDHGEGWVTQYCHMRRGSIAVRTGDTVAQGERLGEVGLSGMTEFAHLEMIVRHQGVVVDPFWPAARPTDRCDRRENTNQLWQSPIPYTASGWISAGFANAVPEYDAIKTGLVVMQPPSVDSNLVLWASAFGGQPNHRIRLEIVGPSGNRLHQHEFILQRHQAQLFRAAGLPAPDEGWAPGLYQGRYSLISPADQVLSTGEVVVTLP